MARPPAITTEPTSYYILSLQLPPLLLLLSPLLLLIYSAATTLLAIMYMSHADVVIHVTRMIKKVILPDERAALRSNEKRDRELLTSETFYLYI